jgi:preprotein translocase subunit SecE
MNRQMKRQQQRQKARAAAAGPDRSAAAASARRAPTEKGKRTGARQFLKEVRQELRKVDWPTRQETIAYSIVVLVSVVVLTTYVFALDYGFSKAILKILGG